MAVAEGTPRGRVETSWAARLAAELRRVSDAVAKLERGASLRNSSISGGEGMRVYDDEEALRLSIDTSGAVTAYDGTGAPVARYGRLVESAPDEYGVEINVDGGWVRLGYQTTGWSQIQKPATFDEATELWDPTPHAHPGSDVTSAVANATNAGHATDADGSASGFARTVGGTEFYALWVDNTAGFKFGRNTSSQKYKTNIQTAPEPDPKRVLRLRPVVYDRRESLEELPPGVEGPRRVFPGAQNEYGLIAEETLPHVPEIVTYYGGEIDGLRYELLPVAMIPLLQEHEKKINDQALEIEALKVAIRALGGKI